MAFNTLIDIFDQIYIDIQKTNTQLQAKDLINRYKDNPITQLLGLKCAEQNPRHIQLKTLHGALDAIVIAALQSLNNQMQIIVLNDKEEAAFLHTDLCHLLPNQPIHILPSAYKKAYQFDEVDNANVLKRAEILNAINDTSDTQHIILTYPEAEKPIPRSSSLSSLPQKPS